MISNKGTKLLYLLSCLSIVISQNTDVNSLPSFNDATQQYHEINIEKMFDNKAFGNLANFDGGGAFFSGKIDTSQLLINYNTRRDQLYDNIRANRQEIPLNFTQLGAIYMLVSASHGPLTNDVSIVYKDGTKDTTTLSLPDWQDKFVNHMDRYQAIQYPTSIVGQQGALFSVPVYVNPAKIPNHLLLPAHADGYKTMHLFSVTAYKSANIIITGVQSTNEWINHKDQIILVTVQNTGSLWIKDASVQINHVDVKTVKKGTVKAVAPGHIQTVQVIVQKFKQQKDVNMTVTVIYDENRTSMTSTKVVTLILDSYPNQYKAATT